MTYGLELMLAVFSIVQGMVSTIITQSGSSGMSSVSLPQELIDAINNVGFWDSIPLWAVTLIGGLLITVLSFTMILTVYGGMFSLWMYAAIAPIPLSTFACEPTSSVGKNFIRSYAGMCLQGVVIALSCIILSAISSSPPWIPVHLLSPLSGPTLENWRSTCWCWSEPLRAVTASLRKLWDCELRARLFCGTIEPRKELRLCLKLFRFVI